MDTSEAYVKMCKEAMEIQTLRKRQGYISQWENGDFCFILGDTSMDNLSGEGTHIIWNGLLPNGDYHDWDSWWCEPPDNSIWLPRQDQLQEMINSNVNLTIQLHGFSDIVAVHPMKSWEQLWLILIMWLKYNKTWDGEQWI